MLIAVLADVHANLHAFEAATAAVRRERPDCVVLLGDVVGYNAFPNECVALAEEVCDHVVRGNHDQDAITGEDAEGTNHAARHALRWTRSQLSATSRRFLAELPMRSEPALAVLAVHGCFISPTPYAGYVTSTMLEANLDVLARHGDRRLGLCGHTHMPMVAWAHAGGYFEQRDTTRAQWPEQADSVLVNPGSVGQPRDRDPRLSFALVDTARRAVEVRRLAYDVDGAARAVLAAGLPPALAQRLKEGR